MLLSYCVTGNLVFCVLFISLKVQGHGRKLLSLSPHRRKQLRYKEVTQLPLNSFPRSSLKWTSLELALFQKTVTVLVCILKDLVAYKKLTPY